MITLYILTLGALAVFSYSQIDLNLTLFRFPWFLEFTRVLISLGYFHRGLSTVIFLVLLFLLSIFYFLFSLRANKLTKKDLLVLISSIFALGLVSYPAFSHDIFNYIFDARTVVLHQQNPYVSTALMFPDDPWTRFMNWTHRTYPYGPFFLPLTLPFYLLGLGKFILTLFWFKVLFTLAYLGSSLIIFRLAGAKGLVYFALNPLVITESIVSSHLDVVMLFFALQAYLLLLNNKRLFSLIALGVSVGIKYTTVLLLPLFILKKIGESRRGIFLVALAYFGAILQSLGREILPHYLIVPLGFTALALENKTLLWIGAIVSLVLLVVRYYNFLLTGVWWPLKLPVSG